MGVLTLHNHTAARGADRAGPIIQRSPAAIENAMMSVGARFRHPTVIIHRYCSGTAGRRLAVRPYTSVTSCLSSSTSVSSSSKNTRGQDGGSHLVEILGCHTAHAGH